MRPTAELSDVTTDAYRWGSLALAIATAVILAALAFEHIGGYIPCPLCLQQRYAYYAGIPALFVALALAGEKPRLSGLLFGAVALAFFANAILGAYQAGAEWKFWPGPETCSGEIATPATTGDLLKGLAGTQAIRCDEASWRLFGLSFAGWNVVVSLILMLIGLQAGFAAIRRDE
ncbi:MAG: disulfide bond formation protein B [Hyphomicrobium sp.]|nr:disulfide bond formation protein B [Hyphomicrobium sp.]